MKGTPSFFICINALIIMFSSQLFWLNKPKLPEPTLKEPWFIFFDSDAEAYLWVYLSCSDIWFHTCFNLDSKSKKKQNYLFGSESVLTWNHWHGKGDLHPDTKNIHKWRELAVSFTEICRTEFVALLWKKRRLGHFIPIKHISYSEISR